MKKDKNLRWFATTKNAVNEILRTISTTKGKNSIQLPDISVLMYLISNMDYDNKIKINNQKEVAETVGITPRRVSMAITKLKKMNFIVKLSETKTYFINPFYFYIGDYRDLHHKYETWKKLRPDDQK